MSITALLRDWADILYHRYFKSFFLINLAATGVRMLAVALAFATVIWVRQPQVALLFLPLFYVLHALLYPVLTLGYRRMAVRAMLGEKPRLASLLPGSLHEYGRGVRFALAYGLVKLGALAMQAPYLLLLSGREGVLTLLGAALSQTLLSLAANLFYIQTWLAGYLFLLWPDRSPFALIGQAVEWMRGYWGEYLAHLIWTYWWYFGLRILAEAAVRPLLPASGASALYAFVSLAVLLLPALFAQPYILLSLGGYADLLLRKAAKAEGSPGF